MANKKIKITPDIIKEIFDEVCKAAQTNEAIINQAIIDLTIFKINKERNVFNQAAVRMFCIANNQAFSDGNKRTSYVLAELILNKKGFKIKANPQVTEKLLLKIATNKITIKKVKEWIKKHAVKL